MYLHCLACIQFISRMPCVFLRVYWVIMSLPRAQATTIGSAFVGRFHGQVTSLGSRLCFLQGRGAFKIQPPLHLIVLFGCSFSRTPAEHSLICLALSHAARQQPIGDSSSALGSHKKSFLFCMYMRPQDFSKREKMLCFIPELYRTNLYSGERGKSMGI